VSEVYRTFPRLPTVVAKKIHADLNGRTLQELRAASTTAHPEAMVEAGTVIDPAEIEDFRDSLRSEFLDERIDARSNGVGDSGFDRELGARLLESLRMSPYEAAQKGVWTFLTLVVLPEIGPWRFPELTSERFVGSPIRNVLGRTWWRARLLGPDLGCGEFGAEPLGEDELYTLVEKTTIGFDEHLVPKIAAAIYRFQKTSAGRGPIVRELTKDLLRVVPWMSLSALEDPELDAFLDSRVDLAARSTRKSQ
jgi:hypothetical protein